MRRTLLPFILSLAAAAVLVPGAFAKEGGVELSSTPAGNGPGEPWTPQLVLIDIDGRLPENAKPGIAIENLATGQKLDFRAEPTGEPGIYTVRVVFPTAGTWDYSAYDGVTGRSYEFPAVDIVAPEAGAKVPAPAGSGDGFPVWALVGGLGGAALLSVAGVLAVRSRRFRLSD